MADPVLVLHLTQGTSIAGAVAAMRQARSECHEVVDPAIVRPDGPATQQLLPWTTPARSLKHPAGTPETNNRGWAAASKLGLCYQIEVVGYSERVAEYGDVWYRVLAGYLNDRCAALGVPRRFPCPFVGNKGYGVTAAQRLTWDEWATVAGIVGHQHVPGNAHWDPGALDATRLTRYMETTTVPTPTDTNPYPAETAEALELLAQHAGYVGDRKWFGPDALAALHRLKNRNLQLEQIAAEGAGIIADLRKANSITAEDFVRLGAERDFHMTTAKRLEGERDTAVANREAAEAEVAMLRKQLQEGGRMPQLMADLDAAQTKLEVARDMLSAAMAKARA